MCDSERIILRATTRSISGIADESETIKLDKKNCVEPLQHAIIIMYFILLYLYGKEAFSQFKAKEAFSIQSIESKLYGIEVPNWQ